MKNLLFLFALTFLTFQLHGQTSQDCGTVSFKTKEEVKASEPCILEFSEYILSKPSGKDDALGLKYRQLVLLWMEKTEHTFTLSEKIMKVFKKDNTLLFGAYTAALSKAAITEKENFGKKGLGLFVEYVKKPENKVGQSKEIKQLIADWDKGNIEAYLK